MADRSKYAVVTIDDLGKGHWESHDVRGYPEGEKDIAAATIETLKALGRKAVLVEMPQGFGFMDWEWEVWLAVALAHGVEPKLAILGRDVYRESYQHQWEPDLREECGWADKGRKMIKLALEQPEEACKRWRYLMNTDGERMPEEEEI